MKPFSVIIPARNAGETLGRCLAAVYGSSLKPSEVLVVDDASTDQTRAVAKQFPCRVTETNFAKGPMRPRFAGAKMASSELLVFLDADVCVSEDTFERIWRHLENSEICAVTGILARGVEGENFFAAFKNEYMNFIFKQQPSETDFLYGSLWAIRKSDLVFFDPISAPFGDLVSDSELGLRLRAAGKKILLDHALEVRHLKRYTLRSLLANDFVIPFLFSLMLLRYGRFQSIATRRSFSHARLGQAIGTAASFLACLGLAAGVAAGHGSFRTAMFGCSAAAVSAVWFYWRAFIASLSKTRGLAFTFKTLLFLPLDQAVMFTGMIAGFFYGLFRKGDAP
jgi:glycosyltransferase involved in cell wall biosynthesis